MDFQRFGFRFGNYVQSSGASLYLPLSFKLVSFLSTA